MKQTLSETWNVRFDNRFTSDLPGDHEPANFRRQVHGACYSRVMPRKAGKPGLVAASDETARALGISDSFLNSNEFLQIFSGSQLLPGMDPFAMNYGGHQFGNWAGQLGDGRAINLGELVTAEGIHHTIQLKGAGATPYSRNADGLAVLRSSIREFLCSEAMFHLGIPTTRALSIITTGDLVERDMFYDGHPKMEPGAVVCRVSPSFIRFGSFEIFAARNELDILKQLLDYTIRTDFPGLGNPGRQTYIEWFRAVCEATCNLIVHWMRTGFVHGVMNTDNMSILGLTIDYGPYGWLEDYNPGWTPNTTDASGKRYCYGNQPSISLWNLVRLANAVYPLIEDAAPLQEVLNNYEHTYQEKYTAMMLEKLGLKPGLDAERKLLITDLTDLLSVVETDMTLFFRMLPDLDLADVVQTIETHLDSGVPKTWDALPGPLKNTIYQPQEISGPYLDVLKNWLIRYSRCIESDNRPPGGRKAAMHRVNPQYILRNYLAQQAIEKAEKNDFSMVRELLDLVRRPYEAQPGKENFAEKRPEWARTKPGCSMLSCSS